MSRTLLVLDYPGRRTEANISDLNIDGAGYDLGYLLTSPLPDEVTGREYAQRLLERCDISAHNVFGILAYCGAAPLAQELAQLLVETGCDPVPLVFFDAVPFAVQDIVDDYSTILHQIDRTSYQDNGSSLDIPALIENPRELIRAMREELTGFAKRSLAEELFDPEEVDEASAQIVEVYLGLLTHQVAAFHGTAPAWGGEVFNIVSAGNELSQDWPGASKTHVVKTAVDRVSLLSSEQTRDDVLRILGEVG